MSLLVFAMTQNGRCNKWAKGAEYARKQQQAAKRWQGRLALWGRGFGRIVRRPIIVSTVLCLHPLASTLSGRAGRSRELSSKKPRTSSLRGRCYAEEVFET